MTTSPLADRMVFVVGAQRSGTTWLQRMLAAHPDVLALPSETHLFTWGISVLQEQTQGGLVASPSTGVCFMPAEDFNAAARAFCDAAFGSYVNRVRPDAARVVERTPNHVWHLDLISAVYPDAWIVHIVRDGRDVVRSLVAHAWGPAEVETAARQWASAIRAARASTPPRYLEVRYEELLARPDDIRDVLKFLDLPPTGDAVEAALREGRRAVNVDPTRPDVASGKWRSEWSADDIAAFDRAAGDVWRELGYGDDDPPPPAVEAEPLERPTRRGRVRRPQLGDRSASRASGIAAPLSGETAQRTVDRLLSALATGDAADAVDVLGVAPVTLSLTDGEGTTTADTAAQAVAELLRDGAWGTPLRGEQHITPPSWTVVLAHRNSSGDTVHRVLVVTFAPELSVSELRCSVIGTSG